MSDDDYSRVTTRMVQWIDEEWAFGDPPKVEDRSSLDADDSRCRGRLASELAWLGISSAREHMHAASLVWHSRTGGITLPTAYGTLLRTAANGAANALWILAGASRNERVGRTSALVEEEHRYALMAIDNSIKAAPSLGIGDEAVAIETGKCPQGRQRLRERASGAVPRLVGRRHRIRAFEYCPLVVRHAFSLPGRLLGCQALPWQLSERSTSPAMLSNHGEVT